MEKGGKKKTNPQNPPSSIESAKKKERIRLKKIEECSLRQKVPGY